MRTDRAAENVVTVVGNDLAYTVDLEHMTRHAGDQPQPRTLRCTQAYRRENGECGMVTMVQAAGARRAPRSTRDSSRLP